MRSKNRRILNESMRYSAAQSLEMKNSIIWEVVSTGRFCNCKILGSTLDIRAYYPESWATKPFWVHRGMPALIRFPLGQHSRPELFSEGQIIPGAYSGGDIWPETTTPVDLIIEGCELVQIPNAEQMAVLVQTGDVRIGGDSIPLEAIPCNDTNNYRCGMGGYCGLVHQVVTISAAPAAVGDYRYDVLQSDTNGVISVLEGTTFRTALTKETVDTAHVAIADVLLHYGMAEIENMDINRSWSYEQHYAIHTTWSDKNLAWDEIVSTITVEVLDSFGNPINKPGYGWYITCEITTGTGSLESTDGASTSLVSGYTGKNQNDVDFIYHRNQSTDDKSPTLKVTLHENFAVNKNIYIALFSSSGSVM